MKTTRLIMGMPITVKLVGPDPQIEEQTEAIFDYFHHVDAVFSTYKPTSEISRLGRGELGEAQASEEVRKVLAACETMKLRTHGYFDIWHKGLMDPSGLVKGWAIWNAAQMLEAQHIENYFIEAGGDIQIRGHNSNGKPWQVGIKHPIEPDKYAKILHLSDTAIATSGVYERGNHIYNPLNGRAVTDPISLTVIGPRIDEADVLATAAFAMGPQKGMKFLQTNGFEAYVINKNLEAFYTPGFDAYVAA